MADEAPKIVKATATNVSGGPKVFNSAPSVILGPGQSTDGEVAISEAEFASMKATGYFSFGDDAKGDDLPSLAGKNKAELLAIAKTEKVEIEDGATNEDIRSAIELKREAVDA